MARQTIFGLRIDNAIDLTMLNVYYSLDHLLLIKSKYYQKEELTGVSC